MFLKHKFYLTLFVLAVLAVSSCKKNDFKITTPAVAEFASQNTSNLGSYFITNDANTVYKIPIGISTVSNVDRTINFTVTSPTGAASGTQYTLPANSITIKAGQTVDTISIKGLFAGYPTGRKDTVIFTITGGDVTPFDAYKTYKLVMQKYCSVDLDALSGDYDNTHETESTGSNPYGPYTSSINLTPLTATTAKIVIENLWDSGIEATGTIDWSDPANFKVVFPQQATGLYYDAAHTQSIDVRTSPAGVSTFSSCDGTLSLSFDFIVRNYPSAGSSAYYAQNYKIYYNR